MGWGSPGGCCVGRGSEGVGAKEGGVGALMVVVVGESFRSVSE